MRFALPITLLLLVSPASLADETLTRAIDVSNLAPVEAKAGRSARLQGVVTYINRPWSLLFLQDDSGAVFVHGTYPDPVQAGEKWQFEGHTDQGNASAYLQLERSQRLGPADFPEPLDANSTQNSRNQLDDRWARFVGTVRDLRQVEGHQLVDIVSSGRRVTAFLPQRDEPWEIERGSQLAARGVWKNHSSKEAAELFVPKAEFVETLAVPPPAPSRGDTIASLTARILHANPVRTEGVVTYQFGRQVIRVQDSTGSVNVRTVEPLDVSPGDALSVVGYLTSRNRQFEIEDAIVAQLESKPELKAMPLTADEAAQAHGQLVQLRGEVVETRERAADQLLVLTSGDALFNAVLRLANGERPIDTAPGTKLDVTGLCWAPDDPNKLPVSVLMRNRVDVIVVDKPPYPVAQASLALGMAIILASVVFFGVKTYGSIKKQSRLYENSSLHLNEQSHSARVNMLGEMVPGLSHELTQPLSAICNFAFVGKKAIDRDPANKQKVEDLFDKITDQAHRAGEVIRRLRNLTEKKETARTMVDISGLIQDTLQLFKMQFEGQTVRVDVDCDDNLPLVRIDRVQFEQVIISLLNNARDAMDGRADGPAQITVAGKRAGNGAIEISVSDQGSGISRVNMKRVFDLFFTTKARGRGIGLTVSRRIVEAHGGRIAVESDGTSGTTFRVRIPTETTLVAN